MTPEQRAERIHHHEYETLEGIHEHAVRIVALEEIVVMAYKTLERAYWQPAGFVTHGGIKSADMARIYDEMHMLGIEVDDDD